MKLAFSSRAPARTTSTKTRARRGGVGREAALPCSQAVLVVKRAWARELNANLTTSTAWLHSDPTLVPLKGVALFDPFAKRSTH